MSSQWIFRRNIFLTQSTRKQQIYHLHLLALANWKMMLEVKQTWCFSEVQSDTAHSNPALSTNQWQKGI